MNAALLRTRGTQPYECSSVSAAVKCNAPVLKRRNCDTVGTSRFCRLPAGRKASYHKSFLRLLIDRRMFPDMTPPDSNLRPKVFRRAKIRLALAGWWDEFASSSLRHPKNGTKLRYRVNQPMNNNWSGHGSHRCKPERASAVTSCTHLQLSRERWSARISFLTIVGF
jgi:hypothetical protein